MNDRLGSKEDTISGGVVRSTFNWWTWKVSQTSITESNEPQPELLRSWIGPVHRLLSSFLSERSIRADFQPPENRLSPKLTENVTTDALSLTSSVHVQSAIAPPPKAVFELHVRTAQARVRSPSDETETIREQLEWMNEMKTVETVKKLSIRNGMRCKPKCTWKSVCS